MKATLCILFSVIFSVVKGLTLNCYFFNVQYWASNEYTCTALDLQILQPFISIIDVIGEYNINRDYKDVKGLKLIDQNIKYLPSRYDVFPNLSYLWVKNSNQQYVMKTDFKNLPKLEHIHFHEGNIAELHEDTFANTPELWYMAISYQKIKSLPKCLFRNLAKLKHVSFHDNQLEAIDKDLFKNNPMIDVIRFNDNHLKTIGQDLLHNLKYLEIVWFQHNSCIDMQTGDHDLYEIIDHYKEKCFNETFEHESKGINCNEQLSTEEFQLPTDQGEKVNLLIYLAAFIILLAFVTIAAVVYCKKVS